MIVDEVDVPHIAGPAESVSANFQRHTPDAEREDIPLSLYVGDEDEGPEGTYNRSS